MQGFVGLRHLLENASDRKNHFWFIQRNSFLKKDVFWISKISIIRSESLLETYSTRMYPSKRRISGSITKSNLFERSLVIIWFFFIFLSWCFLFKALEPRGFFWSPESGNSSKSKNMHLRWEKHTHWYFSRLNISLF